MAGFPHSDILGSQPVYRLPEAYRRFPRPSSAPDAKASTMRSYTLISTTHGGHNRVREKTLKISQEKSHYITTQTLPVLLMLASTIRFSNHYQTPPTSHHVSRGPHGLGRSVKLKPHPTIAGWFVIPGPNNVSASYTPTNHRHTRHIPRTTLCGRAK